MLISKQFHKTMLVHLLIKMGQREQHFHLISLRQRVKQCLYDVAMCSRCQIIFEGKYCSRKYIKIKVLSGLYDYFRNPEEINPASIKDQ